jgi:hypothetical protein
MVGMSGSEGIWTTGLVWFGCALVDFSLREPERDAFPYGIVYNVRVINPELLTELGIRIRRIRSFGPPGSGPIS